MKKFTILIAEDEKNLLNLLEKVLVKNGYKVLSACDGKEALDVIRTNKVDIVVADIKMPRISGIQLLEKVKKLDSSIEVIIMTAFATLETAINALKEGARDYITKPFDIEEILLAVKKTCLLIDDDELQLDDAHKDMLVSQSPVMKELIALIQKVASSAATVYLSGETGTGKELIARRIHDFSPRKNKPFIKVNCSALPDNLLESELFGYEKGAFTCAYTRKLGRFELANEGTIFLDEIGDISPLIQLKLLRVIQEKELERLGGTQTIRLDIRIITATNKDLESLVKSGEFREDLYYRLNVIPIKVPPLRERMEDINHLIDNFLFNTSKLHSKKNKYLTDRAREALLNYNWPGNVRELENIIERILVISDRNQIDVDELPEKILGFSKEYEDERSDLDLHSLKDSVEEEIIIKTLTQYGNNITQAAEVLGISRRSLHRKINKYNIRI